MPCCRRARATGLTSLSMSTKSPVIAALPSAVGWKFMTVTTPMAGSNATPISVMTSARRRHLEETAADIAPGPAKRLLDLLRVERWASRRGRRRAGRAQRCATGGQCLPERFGQLDGITVTLVVHVHHMRRHFVQ